MECPECDPIDHGRWLNGIADNRVVQVVIMIILYTRSCTIYDVVIKSDQISNEHATTVRRWLTVGAHHLHQS